jgi:DNA-binding NtrC family response regulator
MARGEAIGTADLPFGHEDDADDDEASDGGGDDGSQLVAGREVLDQPYPEAKEQALAAFDRVYVARRLDQAAGNVSEAARLAGMDRSNFKRILKKVRGRED